MRIAEASVSLASEHYLQEKHIQEENLKVWTTGKEPIEQKEVKSGGGPSVDIEKVVATQQAAVQINLSQSARIKTIRTDMVAAEIDEEDRLVADLNIRILKAMVERFTGKKIEISMPERLYADEGVDKSDLEQVAAEPGQESAGFGIVYEYHEVYREDERMVFSASGTVSTADGREISFESTLGMSRTFYEENHISIRAGDALKDPLVINFDGRGTNLSDTTFHFDIDSDGKQDQIHFAASGSGFLALDKNNDGEINNGGELFGANTGDGFQELSMYDADRNGWIDENDDIYENLRIWQIDENGQKTLVSLGEKGVGAIYLGHVSSPFEIKDEENNLQGKVRSTGIYLGEDGKQGTVQQVDLVV